MVFEIFAFCDVGGLLVFFFASGSAHALDFVCALNHFDLSYTYHHHLVLPHPSTGYPVRRLLHFLHHELVGLVGLLHPILQGVALLVGHTIILAIGG